MSTRCNVVFTDDYGSNPIYFYRHSDGYPEGAGEDLKEFVKGYTDKLMRDNTNQSAGWLVIRGHREYLPPSTPFTGAPPKDVRPGNDWKCGAYEPTDCLHGDIEFYYHIDLKNRLLIAYKIQGWGVSPEFGEGTKLWEVGF